MAFISEIMQINDGLPKVVSRTEEALLATAKIENKWGHWGPVEENGKDVDIAWMRWMISKTEQWQNTGLEFKKKR